MKRKYKDVPIEELIAELCRRFDMVVVGLGNRTKDPLDGPRSFIMRAMVGGEYMVRERDWPRVMKMTGGLATHLREKAMKQGADAIQLTQAFSDGLLEGAADLYDNLADGPQSN